MTASAPAPRIVGLMDHPVFDDHQPGPGHPERPGRLAAVRRALDSSGLSKRLEHGEPEAVERALLEAVHEASYIEQVKSLCELGGGSLDADTHVTSGSFDAALVAAGAVAKAVRLVLEGTWHRAFCAVRPPGHHALRSAAMGFCLFNNVAIGATAALLGGRVKRVAVLDFDVHHGNGSEELLKERSDVFFASSHEHPLYPGTGVASLGPYSLNFPLPKGAGDAELLEAWSVGVQPELAAFAPELILISAGFDADRRDPLAGLEVTPRGFGALTREISAWADRHADGRIVSVLEGGYDLDALGEDVVAHVGALF